MRDKDLGLSIVESSSIQTTSCRGSEKVRSQSLQSDGGWDFATRICAGVRGLPVAHLRGLCMDMGKALGFEATDPTIKQGDQGGEEP